MRVSSLCCARGYCRDSSSNTFFESMITKLGTVFKFLSFHIVRTVMESDLVEHFPKKAYHTRVCSTNDHRNYD